MFVLVQINKMLRARRGELFSIVVFLRKSNDSLNSSPPLPSASLLRRLKNWRNNILIAHALHCERLAAFFFEAINWYYKLISDPNKTREKYARAC
jgi:hypothetical protein